MIGLRLRGPRVGAVTVAPGGFAGQEAIVATMERRTFLDLELLASASDDAVLLHELISSALDRLTAAQVLVAQLVERQGLRDVPGERSVVSERLAKIALAVELVKQSASGEMQHAQEAALEIHQDVVRRRAEIMARVQFDA